LGPRLPRALNTGSFHCSSVRSLEYDMSSTVPAVSDDAVDVQVGHTQ
jgi:hypothetical protein